MQQEISKNLGCLPFAQTNSNNKSHNVLVYPNKMERLKSVEKMYCLQRQLISLCSWRNKRAGAVILSWQSCVKIGIAALLLASCDGSPP